MPNKLLQFIFFGGEPLSVPTLEMLYNNGFIPEVIICNPDKPADRNLELTPPPTKVWADEHSIPTLQPDKLDEAFMSELRAFSFKLGVVVAYGKIIPVNIVNLPELGLINIHPSLLPKYRGPSPIVSAILNGDTETGVSIIKLDEEMDHGPILAQESVTLTGNEMIEELEATLASIGSKLLVNVLTQFKDGTAVEIEQDHSKATFVKKIEKSDGEINLADKAIVNWSKYRAYRGWPSTFFFKEGKRFKITDAVLENDNFIIKKVIPEGGKEIDYKS